MNVAVIILNWNGEPDTLACLESVAAQAGSFPVWPVVVDNGSRVSCREKVRARFPETDVLESPENLGFAAGANLGAGHAIDRGADYLLFLNNDAWLGERALETLVAVMESHPEIGALHPLITFNPSWLDAKGIDIVQVESAALKIDWWRGRAYHSGSDEPGDYRSSGALVPCAFAHGGALLTRASLFRESGGFDGSLFAYDEDIDYGMRVSRLGYRCACAPAAVAMHRNNGSTRRTRDPGSGSRIRTYLMTRNRILNVRRHAPVWERLVYLAGFLWWDQAVRIAKEVIRRRPLCWKSRWLGLRDGFGPMGQAPDEEWLRELGLLRPDRWQALPGLPTGTEPVPETARGVAREGRSAV